MTVDWSLVTQEHIRQACALYDSGAAVPKRPAQSTFLIWNGKNYPAKFIRGLAYRLATGTELDPSRDYSGGQETVRFFHNLGLATQHGSAVHSASPIAPAVPSPPVDEPEPPPSARRLEPQKQAIADLLRHRFGAIVTEADFPWLTVPQPDQMDETIACIFNALQAMRGHTNFAAFGRSLRCDFFVPSERLIIEYDERQHFTRQRATALELYPPDLPLGFDRQEWIATCRSIQATDSLPPYRDEQRAFYDSLRDIFAARNDVRLIRLRYGTFDWTGAGTEDRLATILSERAACANTPQAAPAPYSTPGPTAAQIQKLALVSHDYNVPDSRGFYDYSEHFTRINRLCDEQGCDTILYALYTWDQKSPGPRSHDAVFAGLANVQRVILEVGQPPESFDHVEIWQRGCEAPLLAQQRFATSSAPGSSKQAFLDDLSQRQINDALLILCGETNIASLVRGSDDFYDPYCFADRLREAKVRLILNPIHDYMRRYEMREKRRHYSLVGRTVISVWNQGKGKESHLPWTIFHDGAERTAEVQELPAPFPERPDIRIGVVNLADFRTP